jgi:predicted membrane protein
MPLLNIVVTLIVAGVALYLVNSFIPMARSIKAILNLVVVVGVCIWLVQVAGLWGSVGGLRMSP